MKAKCSNETEEKKEKKNCFQGPVDLLTFDDSSAKGKGKLRHWIAIDNLIEKLELLFDFCIYIFV